jgi:hypothetical protein
MDNLPGYDAWLTHNPAYDIEECEDVGYHSYNRRGYCKVCRTYDEDGGEDPDDVRDAQIEREMELAEDRGAPLFEHSGE